jgi:hypothetical protein
MMLLAVTLAALAGAAFGFALGAMIRTGLDTRALLDPPTFQPPSKEP